MSPDQTLMLLRILLVEDNEHDLLAFRRALMKCEVPYEIVHYARAEDALKRLVTDPASFDLVVSDYKLPGMTGLEMFKELRGRGISLPVVMLTGSGSEQLAVEALKAGVDDYLIKDPDQGYIDLLPVVLPKVVRKHGDRLARLRAEEALRNSERRLKDIINFLPDATFAIDLEGRVTLWNRVAEVFTGVKAEDILGKGNQEYAIPFYGVRRPILIDLVLKPSEEIEKLYPYVKREGGMVIGEAYTRSIKRGEAYMLGIAAPLCDSEGNVIGAIESIRDITDRKQAEEALRESEQKLKAVVYGSPIPQFVIDQNHTVIYWNKALEEITGIKAEEVIGTKQHWRAFYRGERPCMADVLIDGDIEAIPELYPGKYSKSKLVRDAYEATDFFPMLGADGKWLYFTAAAIKDSKSNVIGAVETIEDITERKKMEEDLLRAQKLESIGLLAGGIAHDFNNLLTAIIGNISLSRILISPQDKAYERLGDAERASLRAKELTQRLLTFARGGAPVRKVIYAAELIRDTAGLASSGSNAICGFAIPDDLWPVYADEGQISQAINNIVINAVQAMPNGGKIAVRCENAEITEGSALPLYPGKYVKISIKDEGIGIPEECIGKIFDPYFTTKESGRGLGLATAYSIIKNHEGHITVESKVGGGTTFTIYLPASEPPASRGTAKKEMTSGKGRILIMDDEEIVRQVAGEMLRCVGCEVEFAKDGSEAIGKYKNAIEAGKPFDAVIMDLTIPGGTGGKEAINRLIEIDPGVKAIVSSGYSNDPIMSNYQEYGFAGVVLKPYKVDELWEQVRKVLQKSNE